MKKIKTNNVLVLFGTSNCGKTSTLRALIEQLTGQPIPSKYTKDIRVIIPSYKPKTQGLRKRSTIIVCTCGDSAEVIEDNIRVFRGELPDDKSTMLLKFDNVSNTYIPISDKKDLSHKSVDICISACRTSGVVVKAMQYFASYNLTNVLSVLWVNQRKLRTKVLGQERTVKKKPNFPKLASELKYFIDTKIAVNRI